MMNPRAAKVHYKGNYKLEVTFSNSEVKEFDLTGYIGYPVYEALKDELFCKKVKVEDGIVTWDEFIDLDPDALYLESKSITLQTASR